MIRAARPLLLFLVTLTTIALALAQSPSSKQSSPASQSESKASSSELASGKKLYEAQCAICPFSASSAKKIGPGLKGLSRRGAFADGKPVTDDSMRVWIENGGKNMPVFKGMLSAEEIRALVAYTKSL